MAVAHEKSNLGSLRDMPHKDQYGNLISASLVLLLIAPVDGDVLMVPCRIADPDLSNPTRPRFERPLETIRSFESAIYGTYGAQNSRPVSFARTGNSIALSLFG